MNRDDPQTLVHELLPAAEAELVLQQTNKPYFVVCRYAPQGKQKQCCPGAVGLRLQCPSLPQEDPAQQKQCCPLLAG